MSDGMKILERIIQQTNRRHGVLASNIANVDTPNYRAKDVSFGQILGNEMGMATTNPKHLSGAGLNSVEMVTAEDTQPWADKNNVEMDMEVAKMTENGMKYEAAITLLTKQVQMFKAGLRTR